ncbi:GNAT family N-acetyltransferase [Bacillaceae bacterium Marseille-Q3522]|nr:GNAT family N-acetyltransferase [Bacillaceae bacterium Marseille-Q3522]
MFVYKIDNNVSLKLIEIKDAETLFKLTDHSRDVLRKWLPWLDTTTKLDDTKTFIGTSLNDFAANKSLHTVILFHNEMVGTASFNHFDWANKSTSIGYWLDKSYHGKGIMTKVVSGLIDYAFNELKLNRVEIRAASQNKKSRAIPERLGLVKEGCIRQAEWLYDHFVDHIVYGMLAEDWKKVNPSR